MPAHKLPIATKKANGTYRPCLDNEHIIADVETPEKMKFITKKYQAVFDQISEWLVELGTGAKCDGLIVSLLVKELDEWIEIDKIIRKEGFTVETPTTIKAHPLVKVKDDKLKNLIVMLNSMGLTPAARSRVVVNEKHLDQGGEALSLINAIKSLN